MDKKKNKNNHTTQTMKLALTTSFKNYTIIGVSVALSVICFLSVYSNSKDSPGGVYVPPNRETNPSQDALYEDTVTVKNFREFLRPIDFLNASALFNSINSVVKQKDSDVFPSGVSFFPAAIPQGTIMYHAGSGFPESFEWLAMDVEFSMNFGARGGESRGRKSLSSGRRRGGGGGGGPPGGGPPGGKPPGKKSPGGKSPGGDSFDKNSSEPIDYCKPNSKNSPGMGRKGGNKNAPFTLMSFQAKRPLDKLIFLDGASAAKTTETGEMDTQILLSNEISKRLNLNDDDDEDGMFFMEERLYADRICKWGKQYGVQGYVRVELGFEVILCDFKENLELVSNVSLIPTSELLNLPAPVSITHENGWPINCTDGTLIEADLTQEQREILDLEDFRQEEITKMDSITGWEQIRIAGDSHKWGDKRIGIDYRHLVTGYNKTYLDPNPYKRRLISASNETLEAIFDELEHIVKHESSFEPNLSNNWQTKTEEIETKFSLFFIAVEKILNNTKDLSVTERILLASKYALVTVKRFTSKADSDYQLGKDFALWQYTAPVFKLSTEADFLIWSSITEVVAKCVDTIYETNDVLSVLAHDILLNGEITDEANASAQLEKVLQNVSELKSQLQWINFGYKCSKVCEWDEICYTPSWGPSPLGWIVPSSKFEEGDDIQIGFTFDKNTEMTVINSELTCLKMDDLLSSHW